MNTRLDSLTSNQRSAFPQLSVHKFLFDFEYPNHLLAQLRQVLSSNCFGTKVTSVKIPNTVRSLASKCFYQAGIKSIEIPNSVAWLGSFFFRLFP